MPRRGHAPVDDLGDLGGGSFGVDDPAIADVYDDEDDDDQDYVPFEEEEDVVVMDAEQQRRRWRLARCRDQGLVRLLPTGPLIHDLAQQTNRSTSGVNLAGCCQIPQLDSGVDISKMKLRRNSKRASVQGRRRRSAMSARTLKSASKKAAPSSRIAAESDVSAGRASSAPARGNESGYMLCNTAHMLLKRELGLGDCGHFSRPQQRHLHCYRRSMPTEPKRVVDQMRSRAYIGQYSANGRFFVAAFQDRRVRLYDCDEGWKLRKDVQARMCRWTITDTALSPDERFLIYASINPTLHLVHIGGDGGDGGDIVDSLANITEVHEALDLQVTPGAGHRHHNDSFGVWSVSWSPNSQELIAGTNDQCIYIYDMESQRSHVKILAHEDDVNAVTYADRESPNIIISGSDDSFVKVWDRRTLGGTRSEPAGVLVGHTEGVTHLDARNDGRYAISNCKDQSIKLWDLRAARSARDVAQLPPPRIPHFHWDYRWMQYPAKGFSVKHPYDSSIKTYYGHEVLQTLVRAYFSPSHTTGQRFIYSGSSDGSVYVYDVVTGKVVTKLEHHNVLVRDCSWHPMEPALTTVSWDGSIVQWGPETGTGLKSEHGFDCLTF